MVVHGSYEIVANTNKSEEDGKVDCNSIADISYKNFFFFIFV
jgi:hypothetical protein